jgi:hypothetical protein
MSSFSVILGSHCHVPDGLPEAEYEAAYYGRLKPFLSALYRYPAIPAVLHYSGPLLYWVERRQPEFFDLIRVMRKRKQIELLSGGFYEPAVSLITMQDRLGQVEMLSTYLRRHFGKRSTGVWIPGACWDQGMVAPLAGCGIAYTFLPERMFTAAGVESAALGMPVFTENQGALLQVFPILPFGAEAGTGALAASIAERGERGVYTIFPERFSADGASDQAAICAFLEGGASLSGADGIAWTTPARLYDDPRYRKTRRLKKVYFQCALEKHVLSESAATAALYAKMIHTRDLVQRLHGDRERKKAALHEVYKAQCCSLYGDAPHGGQPRYNLANPALRSSAYSALLRAKQIVEEAKKGAQSLQSFDFDFDGGDEDVFRGSMINCYVHRKGGRVFGFDYLPASWNYIDDFAGNAFVETLYPEAADGEALDGAGRQSVRVCGDEWWEKADADSTKRKLTLSLPAAAAGTAFANIAIEKTYRLVKNTLALHYAIYNRGPAEERLVFCLETYLVFAGDESDMLRVFTQQDEEKTQVPADAHHAQEINGYQFQDVRNETVVCFTADKPFAGTTGSVRLSGYYQATKLAVAAPIVLKAGARAAREFRLTVMH